MLPFRDIFIHRAPAYLSRAQELGVLPDPFHAKRVRTISDKRESSHYWAVLKGAYRPESAKLAPDLRSGSSQAQEYAAKLDEEGRVLNQSWPFGFYDAKNVKVWPRFGVHRSSVGSFLDVYCAGAALKNPKYELPRIALRLMPTGKPIPEGIFLGPAWYHNFYHWMVDIIPRLQLVGQHIAEGMPIIVPPSLSSAQRHVLDKALEYMGFPGAEVLQLDGSPCRFDRLILPTNMSLRLDISPAQRDFLRGALLSEEVATKQRRRLYISRRDAGIRRIANEAELEQLLADYGFETVVLSGRSPSEQAQLFHSAEAIVGHHGAGLTNLAFCRPGTLAIEIFQRGHFSSCFARMSQLGNLAYGFAVGEPVGSDTQVDIAEIESLLKLSGLQW